ncbi:alkaline phosphatase [Roseicella frigidaeris]|uniref:alkaline phosphatase n=1 Tax=Roseicella frigidaeris TaxID=2230885 RepID=UPI001401F81E|nr:alkaline phosphatase [Roseicella frigidaeris]
MSDSTMSPAVEQENGGATTAGPVKNVILMIADGAGANTLEATRLYLQGLPPSDPRGGEVGTLVVDGPGFVNTRMSTYPLDTRTLPGSDAQNPATVYDPAKNYDTTLVPGTTSAGYPRAFAGYEWNRATAPDSANTASAIANGHKSYNNALNVDGSGDPQFTTAELAHALGKATGVVSTVQISDATPAAGGGAHNISRSNAQAVAAEMFGNGILDVIGGAGNPDYDDNGQRVAAPNHQWIGPDLWAALKGDSFVSADGGSWNLLQSREEIAAAGSGAPTTERLAMLVEAFTGSNYYRAGAAPAGETEIPFSVPRLETSPTLTELSAAALNRLNADPDGLYISIEGGAVDRAMHGNNFGRMIEEYIEFNDTVKYVIDWVNSEESRATWDDTLLIVTADHDHLLFGPNGATIPFQPVLPDQNGDGVPEYSWLGNGHSNQLVPLYAYGAGAAEVGALAQHRDVVLGAQGQAVAGSGRTYTDQTELGDFLLDQIKLGASALPPAFNTLDGEPPLVIGHRGASAYRPEHTLASYKLAIDLGADFVEPDLVVTKDGVLIARHEPELGGTTDVADHPEFADRQTTKMLDGVPMTGWFAEDFTLAEIKTLYARERIPEIRPDNTQYNDIYRIPTFVEVIDLVKQAEAETGRTVGIIPETKHPTYFEFEGTHLDGSSIHADTSQLMVEALVAEGFTDPSRVVVQSFELANLIDLQTRIMPEAGVDLPLVQLMNEGGYDIAFNFDPTKATLGADPGVYGDFDFSLSAMSPTNGDLYTPAALQAMKALYAEAIGPYKDDLLPVTSLATPVDGNGDGVAQITRQLTGEQTSLLEDAHAAGLEVFIYTLRDEEAFQSLNPDGTVRTPEEEYRQFIDLGVDGFFTDASDTGRRAVQAVEARLADDGVWA